MALDSFVSIHVPLDRVAACWERRGGRALAYLDATLAKADPAAPLLSFASPAPAAGPPSVFEEAVVDLRWRWLHLQQTLAIACRLAGLAPATWVSVSGLPMGSLDHPAFLECQWRGPEVVQAVALWLEWQPEPPWVQGQRVQATFRWAFCTDIDRVKPQIKWNIDRVLRRDIGPPL